MAKKFKKPKASIPEKKIAQYLTENKIKFEKEKKFPGLISMLKGELRYDFYIPSMNMIIEFDGPHHTNKKIYGKKNFVRTYTNDKIKDNFAKRMNINLFRISYLDNLMDKLKEIFKK